MRLLYVVSILFWLGSAWAKPQTFEKAKGLYLAGKTHEAFVSLKGVSDQQLSKQDQALKYFALGAWAQELGSVDEANSFLKKTIQLESRLAPYAYYWLGVNQKQAGDIKGATRSLTKVLALKPTRQKVYETRFELSDIDLSKRKWSRAYRHLRYLERKWRNTERYPDVLWRLVKVEWKRKRKWRACRYARKLYSRYPSHPLVYDWGVDLHLAEFEGKKLGCLASHRDQRHRIRRLQWAGESDRARREIEELQKRTHGTSAYTVDSLLANFLVKEGYVDEAMRILLAHHKEQQSNFGYLMLLGKAAARAGEYQVAVGAYHKAHNISPRSRSGRKALFRAAFLSYQFQDYDGAARKFEEYRKRHPRSGLSRDAAWHLSWIRYLKGDYDGAVRGFKQVLKKKRRHRWRWRKFSSDKIKYWLAMSYLRQKRFDLARPIFESLMGDKSFDFYSLAAQQRYNSIPGVTPVRDLASVDKDLANLNTSLEALEVPAIALPNSAGASENEADESEDDLKITAEEEQQDGDVVAGESGEEDEAKDTDDNELESTDFADVKLQQRFDRAMDFIRVGLHYWARWELYEVERRTRNPDYLKRLISAYESINSYHRSAYIGEVSFSSQRTRFGLRGVKDLWGYAYPRAFEKPVLENSKRFAVPKEFIWGIMRQESHFRPDVVSPVGAKGLMQIMPNTGRQVARLMGEVSFHERQLTDPQVNVRLGARYLHRLMKKFKGKMPLVAASYNAGPHRVESWLSSFGSLEMDEFIEHIPFIETRNYVKKVLRNYAVYSSLYGSSAASSMAWLSQPIAVKVVRPSPRETWESL